MLSRFGKYLLALNHKTAFPTVRYAFSLLFLLVAFVGVASVIGQDSSYIRLSVPSTTIKQSDIFSVDVYAYAVSPVNAIDISVKFPDSSIEVKGVDTGESVITLWTESPTIDNGVVTMRGGTYRKGFIGEHKIATINLKAKSTGKAEFMVNESILLAGDGKGTPLKVNREGTLTSIQIYADENEPDKLAIDTSIILVADLNNDGKITMSDISMFMSSWYGNGPAHDLNNDGRMTFRDFSILLAAYFRR